MSTLLDLAFYTATPFWALMILLPIWTRRVNPRLMGPLLVLTVIGFPLYLALRRNLTPLASAAAQLASTPRGVLWTAVCAGVS